MFSLRRVEGWYLHNANFLIRPAPEAAPRPNVEYAQHPWVLRIHIRRVAQLPSPKLAYRSACLRTGFAPQPATGGSIDRPTNRGRKHWVYTTKADGVPWDIKSQWLQEGYFIPDFNLQADYFSNVSSWSPLAEEPAEAYYSRRGFDFKPLTIPASMSDLSGAFERLSGTQRGRFLRSCYWLHTASVVWSYSQSLNLISLINALECLAQSGEKRMVTDASTKMFLQFMQEYAPGRPSRLRLNKIYKVRSLVTHGERLLGYDSPQANSLHPTSTADRESGTEALLLARGAIINWLVREAGTSTNLLSADPLPRRPAAKPGTKSSVKIITP